MKKIILLFVFFLILTFTYLVKAQTYTLTRGLPVAEIAGTGTAITGLADDNFVGPLNIGFSFNFIGTAYTQFYLGSNGIITFGSGSSASSISIPSTSFGNDIIAFACTDQNPGTGTPTLNYFTLGTAPNRILVLNYKNVQQYGNASNITSVQVQLYENNGKIEIHNTLNAASGNSRTIGIQNATGNESYTSTTLNATSSLSANNEMIRFSLPPPCTHSVSITSTATSICDGQSINLTPTITPSGTYTYQWFKDNVAIAGATTLSYATTTAGAFKLRVTNSSSCESFSNKITINKPFTTTIPTYTWNTCESRTATISPSGTYTYQWLKSNSAVSGATTTSLTPSSTGYYKIKATSGSCSITSDSVNVLQNTLTAPNFIGYVCSNVTLYSNLSGYNPTTTYLWSGPNSFTSTSSQPTLNNLTSTQQGIYTVQAIISGCATLTATSSVTVLPNSGTISFTGSSYECGTTSLAFNRLGTVNPTAYLWSGPNGFSSTLSSPQINNQTLAYSGIYTAQVTFSTCGNATVTAQRTIYPNDIYISGNTSNFCPGQNVQLSASQSVSNQIVTYSWSGPGGFTSTVSNPSFTLTSTSVGIYTVTANLVGCKTAIATTMVNTGNITVSAGIDRNLVCPSNTVNLASNINGSSVYNNPPSPTVVSYQWTGPNGFNSTARNPILPNVTTANSGFYTLNAIISGGCVGTNTSVVGLNVNANPMMSVLGGGAPAYCSGESTGLQLAINNYLGNTNASYLWTGPDGFSSSLQYPTIASVGSGGVYTATATFSNGCTGTYTNVVPIFSRRKPVLSTYSNPVCLGSPINLYAQYSSSDDGSKNTYSWQGPDSFSSNQQSPTIPIATNAKLGVYTITLARTGCPETSTAAATVSLSTACNTVINQCYVDFRSIGVPCPGDPVDLIDYGQTNFYYPGTGYTSLSFSWSGPNGFTATGNRATINNITTAGTYTHTMTVVGGTCNGVYTAERLITVKPNTNTPTFTGTVSKTISCEDDSFYFINTVNGGIVRQFTVTTPNGLIYYNPNYFYANKPSQSGTYTINGIMNGECQSSTTDFPFNQSYNITISPRPSAPTISNTQSGQTVTLTGSGCSNQINWSVGSITGLNYNFNTSNPFIDTPPAATSYWAICRSSDGCLSASSNRLSVSLSCTTMQSIQSGLWTNPSIWSCGSVPTSTNVTTISAGHVVTIPASTNAFVRNLLLYGTLGYGQNASLRIGQ